jgi:hypothetical protein
MERTSAPVGQKSFFNTFTTLVQFALPVFIFYLYIKISLHYFIFNTTLNAITLLQVVPLPLPAGCSDC